MIIRQGNKIILKIRVSPNAKRSGIEGVWNNTHIKIALSAPPVDGKANKALIDFLSDDLDIRSSAITITSGQTGRLKSLEIICPTEQKATQIEQTFLNLL